MFGTLKFVVPLWTVLMSICAEEVRGLTTTHAGGASGKKANLNPPTDLRADWIDNDDLTVKLSWSWKRHKGLPKDCIIKYVIKRNDTELERIIKTHFLEELLSKNPTKWMYKVHAVGTSSCSNWSSSETNVTIETRKPHAVDRDFKCLLYKSDMKCSWTSDPASPVTLFYRECGTRLKLTECINKTDTVGRTKGRTECQLSGNFLQTDLCMVANTSNGISTFKAPKVLVLPNMKISEKGTVLQLTWEPLEVEPSNYLFNICYSFCDKPSSCREHSQMERPCEITYEKSCLYKIQYRLQTEPYSTQIYSDWSEEILYRFTDRTLTVVAIVIPVIVSACVILSCICFRRHKHIICPEVPDPSTIFKEMINGNKEMKPSATMYTPVREPVEPIIIVPHIPHSSGPVPT